LYRKLFEKFARKIHVYISVVYGKIARQTSNIIALPPSKIHIIFTSKCNLACDFCYVGTNLNQSEPDRLSLFEWEKIAANIPPYCAVIFSGGEAFASKDIYPVLNIFLKKKRLVSITTNGTLIRKEHLVPLIEQKLFFLMYSIHGLENTHDFHVKKSGAFLKICESINLVNKIKNELKANYPLISIKTVITPENYKEIPDLIEFVENNLNVHHLYFNLMSPNTLHHALTLIEDVNDTRLYQNTSYDYPEEVKSGIIDLINYIFEKRKKSKVDIGFTDDFKSKTDLINFIRSPKDFSVQECNRKRFLQTQSIKNF
jgi:MoaA/NifB/PqqE/SkfB family radical SAM enzyme